MFKITTITAGSAVVNAGTMTFTYPSNTSAGSFAAYGHKLWVAKHQRLYAQPENFTVSFGASDITVTYNGSTTIPAGSEVSLQANIAGADDGRIVEELQLPTVNNSTLGNIVRIDLGSPDTADADGYCVSQDLTSAGVFSVSTTAAAAIAAAALVGTADVPRNVVAAWTGTAVLTVTGTDEYGNILKESSASSTSFTGKKAFKTVTGISSSANITALTVGTGTVLGLPFFVGDAGQVIAEYESGAILTRNNGKYYVNLFVAEAVVDAGTTQMITSPVAGTIKKLTALVDNTVTTGGAFTMEVGDVAVDGLSTVIADGATAGTVASDTPTAGHASTAVAVGSKIEILIAAGFNASANVNLILEIEASATQQLVGTFVAGVTSKATATTGDVRGTYVPVTTPTGAISESLVVLTTDSKYLGVDQYAG